MSDTNDAPDAPPPRKDLSPPWERFPGYTRTTIGWRMGSGESWLIEWGEWLKTLPRDEVTRAAYLARHCPAPATWASTAWGVLHPDDQISMLEMDAARVENLINRGFVQHDVAFLTWCCSDLRHITAWLTRDSPSIAARYSTRDLAFWGRHLDDLATRGADEYDILALIPQTASWQTARVAALARSSREDDTTRAIAKRLDIKPIWPTLEDGWARIAVELAAHGEVSPPWRHGYAPDMIAHDYDEPHHADAWISWAYSTFDDLETWNAYIARHEEAPEAWRAYMEEHMEGRLDYRAWDR